MKRVTVMNSSVVDERTKMVLACTERAGNCNAACPFFEDDGGDRITISCRSSRVSLEVVERGNYVGLRFTTEGPDSIRFEKYDDVE